MTALRRVAAAAAALAAATALALVDPFAPTEPAAAAVDLITGAGTTDSAVTVRWADGITGKDNKTIEIPRQPKGTSAFVDDLWNSFGDLKLTVSQTTGLTHQSVEVTWSGAATTPTPSMVGNYLQLMQCYGDAATGPDPEFCQWGGYTPASLPDGEGLKVNDARGSDSCPAGSPGLASGCDPGEPSKSDHVKPGGTAGNRYYVPFIPVGTDTKIYEVSSTDPTVPTLSQYFNGQSTNEIPAGVTSADNTGEERFELQTGREASGLGCGDANPAAGNGPRECWLVIVPRGTVHPNSQPQRQGVSQSSLGAGAWAQRLQIRLSFLPTGSVCPQDSVQRPMVGTELVAGMITSWQPALCRNGGAVYSFAATPDTTNAVQLASTLPGSAGLAFTTRPITFADNGPPLLYAPIAVTGLTLAFRIDVTSGGIQQLRQIKVNPGLLAKSLTQSYKNDLPGGATGSSVTDFEQPPWMKKVYAQLTADPEWQKVNPGVLRPDVFYTMAPMTTPDQSAVNQSVWAWIQSSPGTRKWLDGEPDAAGMVVNPTYQSLKLGRPPAATGYARADPMCTHSRVDGVPDPKNTCITSVDYIPYAGNLEDAAIHVQRAVTSGTPGGWDPNEVAPNGSAGYWAKAQPGPIGQRFAWGITAAPLSARYGLPAATLCKDDGGGCVAASAASLSAAVAGAKPDSTGLLHVDPANAGTGAYPLTEIVYAAIRTNQDPDALRDDAALLEYAAGAGQTSGVGVGQLPPGYLPMPADLRIKARNAAATLRNIAGAKPSSHPASTGTASPSGTTASPAGTGTSSPTAGVPNGGSSPRLSSGPVPTGGTVSQPPVGLASRSTPVDALGVIRWALVAALVASAGGGLGGLLLRVTRRRQPPGEAG